jgi:aldehyde:ferredoxin oxidoreductase
MKPGGYTGKILHVDLTTRSTKVITPSLEDLYNYVGARGLAEKLYCDLADPKVDPFSPANPIIFMAGPLTGTKVAGAGRIAVVSKSPLTHRLFEASLGGRWGAYLKWAGWDGVMVTGRSSKPLYLMIDHGRVEFCDASDLWGKRCPEVEEAIKATAPGSRIAVLEIGPAGENLSLLANIMHEHRTAGRGGLGAVMGSKRLKAIAVKGQGTLEVADRGSYERGVQRVQGVITNDPVTGLKGSLATFGTNAILHRVNDSHTLPVDNFRAWHLDFYVADRFSGETVKERFLAGKSGCYRCPTACGRVVEVDGQRVKGPEYETVAMVGANAGFYDYAKEIVPLSELCDELGLDTISVGAALAFAREVGLLDGPNPQEVFTNAVKLVEDIAYGRTPLSKGVWRAAQELGATDKAMVVKGLEIPAYDPRGAWGMALNYATCNKGADHTSGYTIAPEIFGHPVKVPATTLKGKAHLVIRMQNAYAIYDSAAMCIYHSIADFDNLEFDLDLLAKLLTAVTGFHYTSEILHEAGARIWDLERWFNQQAGFGPEEDRLPGRFGLDLDEGLEEYYRERGWPGGRVERVRPLRPVRWAERGEVFLPVLGRLELPQLQVALDVPRGSIEEIVAIAKKAYQGGARIIEAGTPALKLHGLRALVGALREALPEDAVILADLKTYDMGKLEAEIAIEAGADIMSVLGKAGLEVIGEALSEAKRRDKAVAIDLMGCSLEEVAALARSLRADRDSVILSLHLGVTEQMREGGVYQKRELISRFVEATEGFIRAVAGGLKEGTIRDIVAQGVDIIVVGSAIYTASDPAGVVARMLAEAREGARNRAAKKVGVKEP